MNQEVIEKHKHEEIEYDICKTSRIDSVDYQVYKNGIPLSIKLTASYQNIADYGNSGLLELESGICEILKYDIKRGFIKKAT